MFARLEASSQLRAFEGAQLPQPSSELEHDVLLLGKLGQQEPFQNCYHVHGDVNVHVNASGDCGAHANYKNDVV